MELISQMQNGDYYNATEKTSLPDDGGAAQNRFCSAGEQVRLQGLSLFIIRSTAEKQGGSAEVDLASDSINMSVPEKEKAACIREIEAQLEAIRK